MWWVNQSGNFFINMHLSIKTALQQGRMWGHILVIMRRPHELRDRALKHVGEKRDQNCIEYSVVNKPFFKQ